MFYLSSSQRGYIDNYCSAEIPLSVSYTIGQHQPAFGISIVDFHRTARVQLMDIVRPEIESTMNTKHSTRRSDKWNQPDLVESGPTLFSARQNTACKFCLNPAWTATLKAPRMAAAPPQSRFIPGIPVCESKTNKWSGWRKSYSINV